MIAYHLTACLLAPGAIILPGNWGRMLNLYATPIEDAHAAELLLKETIFEMVREQGFPTRPSRMHSLFCCPTLEGARHFQETQCRRFDLIYEVELKSENIFFASWNHVNLPSDKNFLALQSYEELAKAYWSIEWEKEPSAKDSLEILSPNPAIVRKLVL